MNIDCWATVRYILDAVSYAVTCYKQNKSTKEVDYLVNKTLPSILDEATSNMISKCILSELEKNPDVIDVVSKAEKILLERLKCGEVSV